MTDLWIDSQRLVLEGKRFRHHCFRAISRQYLQTAEYLQILYADKKLPFDKEKLEVAQIALGLSVYLHSNTGLGKGSGLGAMGMMCPGRWSKQIEDRGRNRFPRCQIIL